MTIGQRVLSIIDNSPNKSISRAGLAKHLGTSKSTVSGWADENRNPSSNIIVPICEYLGVSLSSLLIGNDDNKKPPTEYTAGELEQKRAELVKEFSNLGEDDRTLLLDIAKILKSRRNP